MVPELSREIGWHIRSMWGHMRYVPTRTACELTGLSSAKLREWTSRRALIPADLPPKTQGSAAQYTWQTILLLRLAVTLRDRFHLELQAHAPLFENLRSGLRGISFIALWDKSIVLKGQHRWALIDDTKSEPVRGDAIIINLAPHLIVISAGFSLPYPTAASGQLDLFPAIAVGDIADGAIELAEAVRAIPHRRSA